ncbi:endonuclease/exonuclease/phosphatase family protein [Nocardioides sp.]|uniref:endonuclease/exonuclease/phosphatase family protein n=1 Tax=Nocardioides sp. TaxID=35761 RepID=UPI002B277525|nr:endonuclease/exonuclease/phosphatase family protein [Nocardioides sp.]
MYRTTRRSLVRAAPSPILAPVLAPILTSVLVATMWVLALVLVVPLLASAPADAEPGVSRRGGVPSAVQAPTRVRVVSHNIEKRTAALQRSFKIARRSKAEVILLQEVCWWQAADVRSQHPEWTISYIPERNRDRCQNRGYGGDTLGLRRKVGNLAIWTGAPTGGSSTVVFDHQRVNSDNAGLACVAWIDVVRHRACSAHLIAPQSREDVRTRTLQARETSQVAASWIAQDDVVLLGGDFNAEPNRRTMRFLYKRGGKGSFREAAELHSGDRQCQCARRTIDNRPVKIDYIFFSANRAGAHTRRKLRIIRTVSDHHLLVGWADMDTSVR